GLAACGGQQQAIGNVGGIVVIATDSLWNAVGDSLTSALGPRIFTVRDERAFEVTHIAPTRPNWTEMRNFRQVLALGAAGDAWVQPIVEEAGGSAQDGIVQTTDVWARNQFATAMVLPASSDAEAARAGLPRLSAIM